MIPSGDDMNQTSNLHEEQSVCIPCNPKDATQYEINGLVYKKGAHLFYCSGRESQSGDELLALGATPLTVSDSKETQSLEGREDCGGVQAAGSQGSGAYVMVGDTRRRVIQLKALPEYFHDVRSGAKPFEIRLNDRDFRVSDVLHLREWHPDMGYSGEETLKEITYTLQDAPEFGLMEGYAILGLAEVAADDPGPGIADISEIDPAPSQPKEEVSPVSPGEGYRSLTNDERKSMPEGTEFRHSRCSSTAWKLAAVGWPASEYYEYRIPTSTPAKETALESPMQVVEACGYLIPSDGGSGPITIRGHVWACSRDPRIPSTPTLVENEWGLAMQSAYNDAYDSILNERHQLAEMGLQLDQINAVLGILSDNFGPVLKDPFAPSTDIEERA